MIGFAVFLGALLLIAGLVGAQRWMAQQTTRQVGQVVGPLPEPFAGWSAGDTLFWFHSPTCGPCRAMKPHVTAFEGSIHEVDVTEHIEVARAFSVMATPTTVRVREGVVLAVQTGMLNHEQLEALAGRPDV